MGTVWKVPICQTTFFSVQPTQGRSDADRPHAGNFIEVARGAGGVSDRTFAAELVQAPAFAMAIIAERAGKASGIEVRAARAVFVDHAVVSELAGGRIHRAPAACPW